MTVQVGDYIKNLERSQNGDNTYGVVTHIFGDGGVVAYTMDMTFSVGKWRKFASVTSSGPTDWNTGRWSQQTQGTKEDAVYYEAITQSGA